MLQRDLSGPMAENPPAAHSTISGAGFPCSAWGSRDSNGGKVIGGVSRKIGPGEVIIPRNTPHWFTEITTDQIDYLLVRIDPHKVLAAGYGAK
jgi:hypothetical protein